MLSSVCLPCIAFTLFFNRHILHANSDSQQSLPVKLSRYVALRLMFLRLCLDLVFHTCRAKVDDYPPHERPARTYHTFSFTTM